MSYLSVLSRAIRSYAFSQRAVAVLRCVTIAGSNQKRNAGAHRSAGKPGRVSGGRCRAAARKRATKNPPLPKGGQRGNVNTGSFRMSSGAVHVALTISAGSKSGAGHWGSSVGGEPDWVSGFRYRAAAKRQAIKNPPLPKGECQYRFFPDELRCCSRCPRYFCRK